MPFRVLGAAADQDMEQRVFQFGGEGPPDNCAAPAVRWPSAAQANIGLHGLS